jgi:pimeloyl-ACP methyl ester carboxylesterase
MRDLEHAPSYAVDLPGHGRSEGPGRDSIPAYGDWLISFLEAIHLEQVVLVGHSMGGAIALDVALRHPARVAALGLVASGARLRVEPGILDEIRRDPATAVALICGSAFGPGASQTNVRLGERQMAATPPEVLHGDFVACDVFDVRERLGGIKCPTCVVCGALDLLTPLKYSIYLRDRIARAEMCSLEGCGHMLMIEQPQAVARALDSWLDGLSAG